MKSAGQGYPQDVRRALEDHPPKDQTLVLVAPKFSEGARLLLRELRQSYLDETGSAFLTAAPGLLLHREPTATPSRKQNRERWSPGFADTAELLLTLTTDELPSISALSDQLPLSRATIGKALLYFDSEGWTKHVGPARGAGAKRVLTDRASLLGSWSRWTATHPRGAVLRAHASWRDPWGYLQDTRAPVLPPGAWCLTGWAAAELVAPYSTSLPTLHLYVDEELWAQTSLAVRKVARPVEQGERIRVAALPGALIRLGEHLTWPMASTPRVYADLLGEGSRGEGAADHFREVRLDY